ncbi:Bromodomain-containing protein, putative isoform 4 [Hibiscus syriacus]|uniref:Bromodomain-containing protein, putative isoform 4 n=1 Tax=Hibiscus syriacus TaxID=106335 RepID=A0A6A2ZD99_HIBSY|nr:Bromodomain-containing protein, putative isoform 4 [Hibiscus syriacus]
MLTFCKGYSEIAHDGFEPGKKNRGSSGKVKPAKQDSEANTTNIFLMKQYYFNVIKNSMDLGTIKKKIDSGGYASPWEFYDDVRLTFSYAMTYNPPENDVHVMADTLNKFFEVRWKNIEKKLPAVVEDDLHHRTSYTDEEKHKLGVELESLLPEKPMHIIDFLREHSSNGRESEEEEIEIDIDDLSDDTFLTLRKLLDGHLQEKQNCKSRAEPCKIQLMNKSGLCSSPMQQGDDQGKELVDSRGNEPPVSSYPPKETEETCLKSIKSANSGSSRDLPLRPVVFKNFFDFLEGGGDKLSKSKKIYISPPAPIKGGREVAPPVFWVCCGGVLH